VRTPRSRELSRCSPRPECLFGAQDPAAAIGTLGFDEAEAAKKREGLSKHQRAAADLWGVIREILTSTRVSEANRAATPLAGLANSASIQS
jgi:hypothetical protein